MKKLEERKQKKMPMKTFEIGDNVEALDDIIKGVVIAVDSNGYTVETSEGFSMRYTGAEIIKISEDDRFSVSNYDVAKVKSQKENFKKGKPQTVKPKERNAPKMEVDLHIHQLVPSNKGMTNHEILNIQVDTAKRQLEFAIRKRIQKVVFIHGVGAGVLKEELHYLFGRYEVKHYDADYKKYGLGATEVYIFQNP